MLQAIDRYLRSPLLYLLVGLGLGLLGAMEWLNASPNFIRTQQKVLFIAVHFVYLTLASLALFHWVENPINRQLRDRIRARTTTHAQIQIQAQTDTKKWQAQNRQP